jgi:hypothetical protein
MDFEPLSSADVRQIGGHTRMTSNSRRTLYHAVALEHEDAILVTADERYYGKAEGYGTIRALHNWEEGA